MKILAFPGMGKTPLSKKSGKYLDLDFGHFRESLNVQKDNESKLLKPFAKLMDLYEHSGFIVLSNDPKLMRVTHIDHVYLPRQVKFAARKLNASPSDVQAWIEDWQTEADEHKVPVTYLNVGLDHYLLSASRTRKGGDGNEASKSDT